MTICDYINIPLEERKKHINLSDPCKDGIRLHDPKNRNRLAYFLGLEISSQKPIKRILVCHACNNSKCTNLLHLYFGTDYENIVLDGKKFGTFENIWERKKRKYTKEELKIILASGDKSKGGRANKGIPKSEAHKRKISESLKKKKK